MDRVRPAMLIAARVVDVGRRLPRRCGSAVPPSARLIRVYSCTCRGEGGGGLDRFADPAPLGAAVVTFFTTYGEDTKT